MEQGFEIPGAVQDARDAERPHRWIIGDQLGQYRPEPDIFVRQVIAPVPGPRRCRQKAGLRRHVQQRPFSGKKCASH